MTERPPTDRYPAIRRSLAEELDLPDPGASLARRSAAHEKEEEDDEADEVKPSQGVGAVKVAGLGGIAAVLVAIDQALQAQGKTLADLTINSGPLAGALVANWPVVFIFAWAAWKLHGAWDTHVTWTRKRAKAQDRANAKLVRATLQVAAKVDHLSQTVASVSDEASDLRGRVTAVAADVTTLRAEVHTLRGEVNARR